MRHLHAQHAAIEYLEDVLGAARDRTRDCRDAARFGRHRHQLHALERERAMLAVEQHPIESGCPDHLDDLRRRNHDRDAVYWLAGAQLLFHAVAFHADWCLLLGGSRTSPRSARSCRERVPIEHTTFPRTRKAAVSRRTART